MSIFAQTDDSRQPYLITELPSSVCSSCRSRSNLSYFAGDRSQSELQTETMRSLTWVFYYFTEPFLWSIEFKRYNRFSEGGFSTTWQYNLFTEDFLWFAKVLILTSWSLIPANLQIKGKDIGLFYIVWKTQVAFHYFNAMLWVILLCSWHWKEV